MPPDVAALLDRVEKAQEGSRELDSAVHAACGMDINPRPASFEFGRWPEETARGENFYRIAPVSTSIDAALALVERVLPGSSWAVNGGARNIPSVTLWDMNLVEYVDNDAATPPLAIVKSLLRALHNNTLPPGVKNEPA